MTLYLLLSAFAIMLASLAGIVFVEQTLNHWLEKNLRFLITFSGGVFVVIVYNLIWELVDEGGGIYMIAGLMLAGIVLLEIVTRLIPGAHHHHDTSEYDHAHSRIDARRMLIGDAAHNVGDGILLATSFLVSVSVGIATAGAILVHELAQGVSQFFVLKEAGYTIAQALVRNFIVSTTIILGVIVGIFFSSAESFELPLLALAAGGFVYIILRDLLPHTVRSVRKHDRLIAHVFAAAIGVVLMASISIGGH